MVSTAERLDTRGLRHHFRGQRPGCTRVGDGRDSVKRSQDDWGTAREMWDPGTGRQWSICQCRAPFS